MLHHLAAPLPSPLAAPSRRGFLKLAVGTGSGLVLGFLLPAGTARAATTEASGGFNPFLRIGTDGKVTVLSKHLDKGQGVATGLATLVADELDAAVADVFVEFAPSNTEIYKNLFFGVQGTGGSTAIANSFEQYRLAGAGARSMLIAAASKEWGVPAAEITVEQSRIRHASGREAGFGELAEAASRQPAPQAPSLKKPEDWVYIGKHFPRVDSAMKSRGAPGVYGIDKMPEGALVAVLARPPKWGATVASYDDTATRTIRGVVGVVQVPRGIAVLATSTWPAIKGRDALSIEWDESAAETRGSEELFEAYRTLSATAGLPARARGDSDSALGNATQVIEATYEFPYLAHAPMETLDVVIDYDGESATIWTGSQLQTVDHNVAAQILDLPHEKIDIVTTWAGGSFGRRGLYDAHFVAEAATIAKAWGKAQPIKVVWTREDDIKGGYYRPMYVHRIEAGLDAEGRVSGWRQRIVGQSIVTGTAFESVLVKDGIDHTSVEGAEDMPYAIDDLQVELHTTQVGVPGLWWRAVGHTHTAYAVETMIDQLAQKAGRDPVDFRRDLLPADSRERGVLDLVAEKSGWGETLPQGRFRGVAVHQSFNSYVAEVAEISYDDGQLKVEKVWCAVDCGLAVNPDNIRAQMEGGIGYGLGAILRNEITLVDGEVEQANFDTYEPLRIEDMPEVEVHILASNAAPTGVGEPGTPPIGPAVANAVFAATGEMPTRLPLSKLDLV